LLASLISGIDVSFGNGWLLARVSSLCVSRSGLANASELSRIARDISPIRFNGRSDDLNRIGCLSAESG